MLLIHPVDKHFQFLLKFLEISELVPCACRDCQSKGSWNDILVSSIRIKHKRSKRPNGWRWYG
jgi:hypothetical protein